MQPILIVAGSVEDGHALVDSLRELGRLAVCVEESGAALHLLDVVEFAAVIVLIETAADWVSCERVAAAADCPIAVVTQLLADDRRYRERAFALGVSAYVCEPCTKGKLRAMLLRLREGEVGFELTDAVCSE